jgi:Tfp pilus assembly protein PilP
MRFAMVMVRTLIVAGLLFGVALTTAASVLDAAPQTAASPSPSTATPGVLPTQTDPYTYNPLGRRDPFVSLVKRGNDSQAPSRRSEGLAGLTVDEIALRGLMHSQGGYVAIVQGTDNKTYIARENDRLQDGTIRSITVQGLVILQEVNDPLSLAKQKEVRKGLRATEEGK